MMNTRSTCLLSCAIGAALVSVAAGQARSEDSASPGTNAGSPMLEEIVVTADRRGSFSADLVQAGSFRGARQLDTPLTINVISDALIQSQQAQGLLDALRNTAGVSPAQTSTTIYANIAIRGINVENRGNYRLNGTLPIVNLVDLPLEDKDRVEALKGASALYYGFTAPSGIINLTMKRPTSSPHLATTIFGNEYGQLGGHVDAGNTWGTFGARVNAVYGTVDSGIDNTRGHRSLLAAALDYKPIDSLTLSVDAEHILKKVNEPGVYRYVKLPTATATNLYPAIQLPPLLDSSTNFAPDWASNRAEERNLLVAANWSISPAWALSVSYGNSHLVRDRHFSSIDLNTYGPNTDGTGLLSIGLQPGSTYDNQNYRGELAGAVKTWFMTHQILLGASQNIRDSAATINGNATCPGATPTAPRATCVQNIFNPVRPPETSFPVPVGLHTRISDTGYYLFDRIEMTDWLQVLGGVRKSDYEEQSLDTGVVTFRDKPTSLSYGAVVKPLQWMSIYGTYIEGLESTPSAPNNAINFGQQLPATQSEQREFGIKIEPFAGLLAQVAYFNIERGATYVNGANVYVLDGRARFKGTEFSVSGEITPDWSLYATGQFLDAKQISGAPTVITTNAAGVVTVSPTLVGRKIENTPQRTFSLASEYRFSNLLPGFSLSAGAYYISDRALNQFNQAFIPSYTLYDVGAAYRSRFRGNPTTFRVNAQNVADKKYFAATGGNIVAQGTPRMIKFSVQTQFGE
jgi:iron complex outermembrane receptor protein